MAEDVTSDECSVKQVIPVSRITRHASRHACGRGSGAARARGTRPLCPGVWANHVSGSVGAASPLAASCSCATASSARFASRPITTITANIAAILGCLAAGPEESGHADAASAIRAMARQREDLVYLPQPQAAAKYEKLYAMYRSLASDTGALLPVMRSLRNVANV